MMIVLNPKGFKLPRVEKEKFVTLNTSGVRLQSGTRAFLH